MNISNFFMRLLSIVTIGLSSGKLKKDSYLNAHLKIE